MSDSRGIHDSFCQGGGKLVYRHNCVRDIIYNHARRAGLQALKEPNGIMVDHDREGERPADIYFQNWDRGKNNCVDVTVVCAMKDVSKAIRHPGNAIDAGVTSKNRKYLDRVENAGMMFTPFVMDTFGCFSADCMKILSRISTGLADVQGISRGVAKFRLTQQLQYQVMTHVGNSLMARTYH